MEQEKAAMLVISSKENESIVVEPADGLDPAMTLREVFAGGPIVMTLKQVGLRNVRLVIEAPRTLKISRREPQAGVAAGSHPDSR